MTYANFFCINQKKAVPLQPQRFFKERFYEKVFDYWPAGRDGFGNDEL